MVRPSHPPTHLLILYSTPHSFSFFHPPTYLLRGTRVCRKRRYLVGGCLVLRVLGGTDAFPATVPCVLGRRRGRGGGGGRTDPAGGTDVCDHLGRGAGLPFLCVLAGPELYQQVIGGGPFQTHAAQGGFTPPVDTRTRTARVQTPRLQHADSFLLVLFLHPPPFPRPLSCILQRYQGLPLAQHAPYRNCCCCAFFDLCL